MIIAGIDPGLDGALALYDADLRRIISVVSVPTLDVTTKSKKSKREINKHSLKTTWSDLAQADKVFLEEVHSGAWSKVSLGKPVQMGVTSAFQFGRWFGLVEMLIVYSGVSCEYVSPQKWKKELS